MNYRNKIWKEESTYYNYLYVVRVCEYLYKVNEKKRLDVVIILSSLFFFFKLLTSEEKKGA